MKTIWKFPLVITDLQILDVPLGAEVLCVQTQNEKPCLWMKVDDQAAKEGMKIAVIGTGNNVSDEEMEYLGSCQMHQGALVWHVFEVL